MAPSIVTILSAPVGNHGSSLEPHSLHHHPVSRPGSPEFHWPTNEVDLEDVDFNELREFLDKGAASSRPHDTATHQQPPSTYSGKRPYSLISTLDHSDQHHYSAQHPNSLSSHPAMRAAAPTSSLQSPHTPSRGEGAPARHLGDNNEFKHRYHVFNRYPWQATVSQKDIEELYKRIGKHWRPMARSTLMDTLAKLGDELQRRPKMLASLLQRDESTISTVADITAPKNGPAYRSSKGAPIRYTVESFLNSGIIERARRERLLTDLTLRSQPNSHPQWAPKEMNVAMQKKFLAELQVMWRTTEVTARSRLYKMTHFEIVDLIRQALPEFAASNPPFTFYLPKRRKTS